MVDTKDAVFYGALLAMSFEKLFKHRDKLKEILDGKDILANSLDSIWYNHTPEYKTCICTISLFGFEITGSHFDASGTLTHQELNDLAFNDAYEKAKGLIAFTVKVIDSIYPTDKELLEKNSKQKHSDKAKSDEATLSKHIFVVKM